MVYFRCRGRRLLLRENSLDAPLVDRYRFGWRVSGHLLPLTGSLDGSGREKVVDAHAVIGFADGFVADWAGHFGMSGLSLERMFPF